MNAPVDRSPSRADDAAFDRPVVLANVGTLVLSTCRNRVRTAAALTSRMYRVSAATGMLTRPTSPRGLPFA